MTTFSWSVNKIRFYLYSILRKKKKWREKQIPYSTEPCVKWSGSGPCLLLWHYLPPFIQPHGTAGPATSPVHSSLFRLCLHPGLSSTALPLWFLILQNSALVSRSPVLQDALLAFPKPGKHLWKALYSSFIAMIPSLPCGYYQLLSA